MHDVPRRTVAVVGDLILAKAVNAEAASRGPHALLAGLQPLLDADLAIANLESVATAGGVARKKEGIVPVHFRTRPETLGVLSAAGIDAVATANNHVGDYGSAAVLEQLGYLEAMGLAHPGSGITPELAAAPAFLDAGEGIRVALFAADTTEPAYAARHGRPGTCYVPLGDLRAWERRFRSGIAEARRRAHAVLFAVHWGDDWAERPSRQKRALGQLLIDMGVDAVLGSNAHVVQGVECYADGVILHDTGHALTPFERSTSSAVFTLAVGADGVASVEAHPIIVEARGRGARMAGTDEAAAIRNRLAGLSAELGTAMLDGVVTAVRSGPREAPDAAVVATRAVPVPPRPAAAPPPECRVDAVPATATIEPISVGPLTLVGMRLPRRRYIGPRLVEVDLYWTIARPMPADLRIVVRGRRSASGHDWLADGEPCDWAWPTSRWVPGQVYRDRVQLRPPPGARSLAGVASVVAGVWGPLELLIGVFDGDVELATVGTARRVKLGLANALLIAASLLALLSAILLDV